MANTMVIAVFERRWEIGVAPAQGAWRHAAHLRVLFLGEPVLLASLGGAGGAALGALVTAVFAAGRDWPFARPGWEIGGAAALRRAVGASSPRDAHVYRMAQEIQNG